MTAVEQPRADDGLVAAAIGRQRARRRRYSAATLLARVVFLLVVLVVWQLAADRLGAEDWISSPLAVATKLASWAAGGTLLSGLQATLIATLGGFVIGAAGGAVLGFLLGWVRPVGDVLSPYLLAFYTVPKIALAPLFVLWFGIGTITKIAVAALLVFFLVFFTTFRGIRDVDRELVDISRVLGASPAQTLRVIGVPSAMIWVFSGLRMALPYALIGAVVGEFIAATDGIGFMINNSTASLDTAGVFAGVIVLMVVAFLLTELLRLAERWVLRWQAVGGHW